MSANKLAVLLCAVMACADAAIAQAVWTAPIAPPPVQTLLRTRRSCKPRSRTQCQTPWLRYSVAIEVTHWSWGPVDRANGEFSAEGWPSIPGLAARGCCSRR